MALIAAGLAKNTLYEKACVNFLSAVPRPLDYAAQMAESGFADKITQVYDLCINFVVLEPDLFGLHLKDTYFTLNSHQTADSAIESTIEKSVSGLFSVAVTMGTIPIIR